MDNTSRQKQRPPRFLSFKAGDKIVICPHQTLNNTRGLTGEVLFTNNHLEVGVSLDEYVSPFNRTEKGQARNVPSYMLRHASECHDCVNRMRHMQGGFCPTSCKDIVFYEKEETKEPSTNQTAL